MSSPPLQTPLDGASTTSDTANNAVEPPSPSAEPSEKSSENSSVSEEFNPDWRFVVAFSSLSVITLMAALDATSLSVALAKMARVLNGTAIEAFWAGTSFLLTSTVFQPPIGAFSHIFGRKPMIYVSLVFFGAGAIVAALANNFTVILVGRTIQGIGGGGVISLTEIVVTDLVPLRERGKWMGMVSSMWSLGTVIGPLLGGGFSQNVTWRWIFWINLPFIGVATFMFIFFLKLNFIPGSFLTKLRRVDWIGAVVFVAATTGFLVPLSWGGIMYSWTFWRTLLPLILCGAGLVAFIIYEEYVPAEPLIRTVVFKNRTAAVTYFETFIHGLVLWCTLYYLPLYFEAVKGFNPILTGVALFPQTFTVAPAAMAAGFIIAYTGRYRWGIWSGWFLTTFGFGIMTYIKVDTSTPAWIFINLVPGFGTGILFSAMALAIQASSKNEDQAYAVNMFAFLRAFGQTVGVAIGGVIFQNSMKRKLETYPLLKSHAHEYAQDASSLVELIKAMPAGEEKSQLLESYVYALRIVWIVSCALAAVALVASLGTKGLPLDRALETEQGYVAKNKVPDAESRIPETEKKDTGI
ncbi:MFS general substrate transporter [Rhizodiscina lignyota]|uniref:MFS general substrate transporter n=1 Tax=Rhizodiscina lignyota TaxID=1504668 RepID=A0A9P4IDJ5_9PEZI|nr:MFS general substrate transporter [Rhizodiscina lignyota]